MEKKKINIKKKNILIIGFSDLAYSLCKNLMTFNNDVWDDTDDSYEKFVFDVFVLNKESDDANLNDSYSGSYKYANLIDDLKNKFNKVKKFKDHFHLLNLDCTDTQLMKRVFASKAKKVNPFSTEEMNTVEKLRKFKDKGIDVCIVSVGDKISTILKVTSELLNLNNSDDLNINKMYVRINEEEHAEVLKDINTSINKTHIEFFNVDKLVSQSEAIELVSDSILSFIPIDLEKWENAFSMRDGKMLDSYGVVRIELLTDTYNKKKINKKILEHIADVNSKPKIFGYSLPSENNKYDENISAFDAVSPEQEFPVHTHLYIYGKLADLYSLDEKINKSMYKSFIIVGLHGFGKMLAQNLDNIGNVYSELLVIDKDKNQVEKLMNLGIQSGRILDASSLEELENVGLEKQENLHSIVCIEKDSEIRMRVVLNLLNIHKHAGKKKNKIDTAKQFIKVKLPSNTQEEKEIYDSILHVDTIVTNDLGAAYLIPHLINNNNLKYYNSLDANNILNWKEYGIAKIEMSDDVNKFNESMKDFGLHVITTSSDIKTKDNTTNKKYAIVWGHLNKIIMCSKELDVGK